MLPRVSARDLSCSIQWIALTETCKLDRHGNSPPGRKREYMRYRRLGRTNLHISEIGHGLWGMSGWTGSDDQQSTQALQTAADFGCNFFDTAWAYGQGKSDSLLGELLERNPRKRLFTASKVPPMNMKWP